jgi:hypothetical protein
LALAWAAAAQGLPPGALLLARVKAHTRQELARLPNCSCLEIVHRDHQPAGGTMRPLDTVRLEVLYSNHRELYALPGDRSFGDRQPMDFAGSGTIGNGHFALFLSEISSEGSLSYEYKGEESLAGRRLARFDYRVPVTRSGHTITLLEGRGTVGIKGSFWADPATYDIARIAMEAEDFPPTLPVVSSVTSVDYARSNLDGTDLLLPRSADSTLVKFSGEASRNHIEFTRCRLFRAQSSISFGETQASPVSVTSSALEEGHAPPPALQVVIRLSTRITGETLVGDLVEGVVEANVREKKSVLIPRGSVARGRVRRLERHDDQGGYYVVGLEFTEIEAGHTGYRFFADLVGTDRLPGLGTNLRTQVNLDTTQVFSVPELLGVGTFFVQAPRLDLPPGFRMTWKTRALVP